MVPNIFSANKLKYRKFLNGRNGLSDLPHVVILAFSETVWMRGVFCLQSLGILDLCGFPKIMESGLEKTSASSLSTLDTGFHGFVWAELLQVVPDLILTHQTSRVIKSSV